MDGRPKRQSKKKYDEDMWESEKPAIKLTIKLGGQTVTPLPSAGPDEESSSGSDVSSDSSSSSGGGDESPDNLSDADDLSSDTEGYDYADSIPTPLVSQPVAAPSRNRGRQENSEDEWLEALEGGELNDLGQLKRKGDDTLTARQRSVINAREVAEAEAIKWAREQETVVAPVLTEAQLQKRQQRAKKRRLQAHDKREKEKKQTLDKLLLKQDVKLRRGKGGKSKQQTDDAPRVRYLTNQKGAFVCLPPELNYPMEKQEPIEPPKPVMCCVDGCGKLKKYSSSKTGQPLCSLECYRTHLTQTERVAD